MNKTLISLVPLAIALASIAASCSKKEAASTSGKEPSVQTTSVAEVWTCPMHPQIKKSGPGSCPICGMNLVKVADEKSGASHEHAEAEDMPSGHAPIRLSQARQQMIGVKLGRVQKEPLFKSIEAAGRVAFDPELYTAQSEYAEAVKQLARVKDSPLADVRHSAERMVESAKLRLKILGLSDKQIRAIHETDGAGSNLLIPKPGENFWIYAEVYEMDLPSVQPGLEARISGGSLEGRQLTGKVVSVDRVINPTTRTAKVRISVPEAKSLRPESYVDVTIRSPLGSQVAVPFDALFDTGKEAWVFIALDKGEILPRRVQVKFRADDWVAIESGLEGGEQIVTSANFLIDSESRLKGTLMSQGEEPRKAPECPEGQFWHEEMKHCMAKAGK